MNYRMDNDGSESWQVSATVVQKYAQINGVLRDPLSDTQDWTLNDSNNNVAIKARLLNRRLLNKGLKEEEVLMEFADLYGAENV